MYYIRQSQPREIRPFFFPAFFAKIIGGVSLGLIYMYYYQHGDTTAYFRVANVLNEGINDSIVTWAQLIFGDINSPDLFEYKSRMSRYTSGSELFLIRITSILSMFSFKGYYTTVLWFASFSFLGSWFMYKTLIRWYPDLKFKLAIALFFIPSVVFWGSGLMKDSIVLGCLGFLIFGVAYFRNENKWIGLVIISTTLWLLTSIRGFMLPLLLIPAFFVFLLKFTVNVKHFALRGLAIIIGVFLITAGTLAYFSEFSNQLMSFAREVQISSNYLYRVSLQKGGSAYSIGTVDGTIQNLVELAPSAIWVALYRPYPWEANNLVMLLTALENLTLLLGTLLILLRVGVISTIRIVISDDFLQYAIVFCIFFAFVAGISTFNFGSLARYRIPILPFFVSTLIIIMYSHKLMITNKS